jgi:AcrR family transcriptional regulator
MATRDAELTRARILAAAIDEFSTHGYAGGRIDRIAQDARSNVRMIYAYYGGKSALFDAAVADAIRAMAESVPPRTDDLAEWTGELFDYHQHSPATMRLSMWAQLERPEATAEPLESYAAKVAQMRGVFAPLTAVDMVVIIYAIAQAWALAPVGLVSTGIASTGIASGRSEWASAQRRNAAVTAVARILGQD